MKDTIEDMISTDYRERFRAEYNQTKIRLERLSKLIDDYENHNLTFQPKSRLYMLVNQKVCMLKYIKILRDRALIEEIDLED